MNSDPYLKCHSCCSEYSLETRRWNCECGGYFDLEFHPHFPFETIRSREYNMWRYREAIPIKNTDSIISLEEGFTPLSDMVFNGLRVKVKFEHLNPTGSFKDRGASVLISRMKELGVKNIIEDSSGNAGSAIAAYADRAAIECNIYVPESIPDKKTQKIASHGARIVKISGTREETATAAIQTVMENLNTLTYASHVWNPYFLHGTKTFAYELFEQMHTSVPDILILPVGNGTLLLGCYIGFRELLDEDIIDRLPKIIGVQSRECNPLVRSFSNYDHRRYDLEGDIGCIGVREVSQNGGRQGVSQNDGRQGYPSIADGINVASPIRGDQIVEAVKETSGIIIDVSDEVINETHREICAMGHLIEPTAAVGMAGALECRNKGNIDDDEIIVTAFTGHGFHSPYP